MLVVHRVALGPRMLPEVSTFGIAQNLPQLIKFSTSSRNTVFDGWCGALVAEHMTKVCKLNFLAINFQQCWDGSQCFIVENLGFCFFEGYFQTKSLTG